MRRRASCADRSSSGGMSMSVGARADSTPEPSDTARIGERLKAVRRAQRRTLEEVAEASGLTKGFLSKIERDLASASVAALLRICATLGIPLSSLFENQSTGEVVRAGHYPRIDFGGQDLTEYLLTPHAERRVQVIMSEIQPGGGSGNEGYALPAEVEFVYVVSGSLDLGFRRAAGPARARRRLHLRPVPLAHLPGSRDGRADHRDVGDLPGAGVRARRGCDRDASRPRPPSQPGTRPGCNGAADQVSADRAGWRCR